ncbi:hypothetical protein WAF17_20325 [Bernardetia sp. ABR2-2B]|uniref:hypothetical protein n=1 Tax=Bernardetia sp. ABR2-2B TaxID=3127472 RepID=UPI0030D05EB4
MKHTKKESWERIIYRTDKFEKVSFILPTVEWLLSKGCDELFYASFSHYDLILVEDLNWWKSKNNNTKIIFKFNTVFSSRNVLTTIDNIRNQFSKEEKEEFLELEKRCQKQLLRLAIEIQTKTEHYSHITKINEYDEFEIILNRIMNNLN